MDSLKKTKNSEATATVTPSNVDLPKKRKREGKLSNGKKKIVKKDNDEKEEPVKDWQNDNFCWECHKEGVFICCEMCPRVFHIKCANLEKEPEDDWACAVCHAIMLSENMDNRSQTMELISVDQLCELLKYALSRVKKIPAMSPFLKPVDQKEFPTYWEIIVHPVDIAKLEQNIKKKFYGSTEAFMADVKWIVHNSIAFNGANSKVTSLAKTLIKVLRQEMSEIETCPDCYENAHKNPDRWFVEACRLAHPLVWARLKGFPFWPAKAVKWKDSNVDVRFFGRHDRSWVPLKECYLLSEQMPVTLKNKHKTLETCLTEVAEHIKRLTAKFGKFEYASHRVPFNPYDADQINAFLPQHKGIDVWRVKPLIFTKALVSSGTDDETSSVTSSDSIQSGLSGTRSSRRRLKGRPNSVVSDSDSVTESITSRLSKLEEKPEEHHRVSTPTRIDSNPDDSAKTDETLVGIASDSVKNVKDEIPDLNETSLDPDMNYATLESSHTAGDNLSLKDAENSESYIDSIVKVEESEFVEEHIDCYDEAQDLPTHSEDHINTPADNSDHENVDMDIETQKINETSHDSESTNEDLKSDENSQLNKANSDTSKENELSHHFSGLSENSINPIQCNSHPSNVTPFMNRGDTSISDNNDRGTADIQPVSRCDNSNAAKESDTSRPSSPSGDSQQNSSVNNDVCDMDIEPSDSSEEKMEQNSLEYCNKDEEIITNLNNLNSDDKISNSEDSLSINLSNHIKANQDSKSNISQNKTIDTSEEGITPASETVENLSGEGITPASDTVENREDAKSDDADVLFSDEESSRRNSMDSEFSGFTESTKTKNKVSDLKESIESNTLVTNSQSQSGSDTLTVNENFQESAKNFVVSEDTPNDDSESSMIIGKIALPSPLDSQCNSPSSQTSEESTLSCKSKEENISINIKSISINTKSPAIDCDSQSLSDQRDSATDEGISINLEINSESNFKDKLLENKSITLSSVDSKRPTPITTSRKPISETNEISSQTESQTASISNENENANNSNSSAVDSVKRNRSENSSRNSEAPESSSTMDLTTASSSRDKEHAESHSPTSLNVKRSTSENSSQNGCSKSANKISDDIKKVINKCLNVSVVCKSRSKSVDSIEVQSNKSVVKSEKDVSSYTTAGLSSSITITNSSTKSQESGKISSVKGFRSVSPRSCNQSASVTPPAAFPSSSTGTGHGVIAPQITSPRYSPSALSPSVRGVFPTHPVNGGKRAPGPPGHRLLSNGPNMGMNRIHGPLVRHLPPDAGPLSAELHKHSHKLAEIMRNSLEEVLAGLVGLGTPEARLGALQLELERSNWRHQQEVMEIRHNADVMMVEMRASLEADKQRALEEMVRQMDKKLAESRIQMEKRFADKLHELKRLSDMEKQRAVEETKKKQWCASCGKEALFFCCWNTSYCDYPCQQAHWPQHMSSCGQNHDSAEGGGDAARSSESGPETSTPQPNTTAPSTPLQCTPNPSASAAFVERTNQSLSAEVGSGSPLSQPVSLLAPGGVRTAVAPTMAALTALSTNPNPTMIMNIPRFISHPVIPQQNVFGGMDTRMMFMMNRAAPPGTLLRGQLQSFTPRFM